MNKSTLIGVLTSLLSIVILVVMVATPKSVISSSTTISPSPTLTPTITVEHTFPNFLVCSDVEITETPGATWNGITIGVSTPEDLSEYFQIQDQPSLESGSGYMNYRHPATNGGPYWGKICMRDSIIVAFSVRMTYVKAVFLTDFVVEYGIPDAVTYDFNPDSRVAFWFEHGVAIVAYTRPGSDFGQIREIIYFPPQTLDGYAGHWPYNSVWPIWIPPHEVDDSLPSEQNPFDFEAMLITGTVQPLPTPTATPTPEPTSMSN